MAQRWRPDRGTTLDGRYVLEEELGTGPTGVLFSAREERTGETVVVKVFHPALFHGSAHATNLLRLQRARAYVHPNVVALRDVVVGERAYAVTDLLLAPPLDALVAESGRLSRAEVERVLAGVVAALKWIHQIGVHGNLKPSNVFLPEEGDAIVSDPWFLEGIPRIAGEGVPPRPQAWLAPEQIAGAWQERPQTDVHGLALLFGWMLAGRPVEGGRPLSRQGADVGADLDAVFLRATDLRPEARHPTVDVLLKEILVAYTSAGEVPAPEPASERPSRSPVVEVAGAAAAAAAEAVEEPGGLASEPDPGASPAPSGVEPEPVSLHDSGLHESGLHDGGVGDDEPLDPTRLLDLSGGVPGPPPAAAPVSPPAAPEAPDEGLRADAEAEVGSHEPPRPADVVAETQLLPELSPFLPDSPSAAPVEVVVADLEEESDAAAWPLEATDVLDAELVAEALHPDEARGLGEAEVVEAEFHHAAGSADAIALGVDDVLEVVDEEEELAFGDGDAASILGAAPVHSADGLSSYPAAAAMTMRDVPGPGSARALDAARLAGSLRRDVDAARPAPEAVPKTSPSGPPASGAAPPAEEGRGPRPMVYVAPVLLAAAAVVAFVVVSQVLDRKKTEKAPAGTPVAKVDRGDRDAGVAPPPAPPGAGSGAPAVVVVADAGPSETAAAGSAGAATGSATGSALGAAAVAVPASAEADATSGSAADGAGSPGTQASPPEVAPPAAPEVVPPAAPPSGEEGPGTPPPAPAAPSGPADPKALHCPGGMARIGRKTTVELADGTTKEVPFYCIDRFEYPGKGQPPKTDVSLGQAKGACAGRGKRLCTRKEWASACGGKYPYRGDYDPTACNTVGEDFMPRPLLPSGSKERCKSAGGIYDMVGNAAEWTSDGRVNGGSAYKDADSATCARTGRRTGGSPYVGFRCCADPVESE